MRKTEAILLLTFLLFFSSLKSQVLLDGNNIRSGFQNSGVFEQYSINGQLSGFEWPKGSGKIAIFTAGICIAGLINTSYGDKLAECMASYTGEWSPGYCISNYAHRDSTFRFYKVKRGDNQYNNYDWANWGRMVQYGAPFIDVNHNGIYDPAIDTPGVKNAAQTIFLCMTDGFASERNSLEGFGGGINTPLFYAEVHLTAWCYDTPGLEDVQFIKWVIINKNNKKWENVFASIVSDLDIGNPNDDYIGCDTIRNLSYGYNATNYDSIYGVNPPAAGFLLLRGFKNKNIIPYKNINLSAFTTFANTISYPPACECDPNGEAYPAYLLMQGYKKDSTNWMDVSQSPPKKTKILYSGDPETNTGWTESKGSMKNCGLDSTGPIIPVNPPGDRRLIMNIGAENFSVKSNDTQTLIVAQLIAQGNSNLNSVTKLKMLSDSIISFYNEHLIDTNNYYPPLPPTSFILFQNYPNPFNAKTVIKYQLPNTTDVNLTIYDITGRNIAVLVNEQKQPGYYEVTFDASNLASGIYFYQLRAGEFISSKKLVLLK
jgi:hypothetical protein